MASESLSTRQPHILVTGSNGLLGQKITQRFLRNPDFQLTATSLGDNRFPVQGAAYRYFSLDVTDRQQVEDLVSRERPDAIIHTAAMANPDACEPQPEACRLLNVEAVRYLSDLCQRYGVQLVHLSTDFIFDGTSGPYREDDLPSPISRYGQSKADAEKIVMSGDGAWTILRTALVYGYLPQMSRGNIVLWIRRNLMEGKPVRVVNDQFRTPTLAEDLAEACLLAVKRKATGVYHISGDEFFSVFEIAQHTARFWGLDESLMTPVSSDALAEVAKRPPVTGFIVRKAIEELGFRPHSLREGLAVLDEQLREQAAI